MVLPLSSTGPTTTTPSVDYALVALSWTSLLTLTREHGPPLSGLLLQTAAGERRSLELQGDTTAFINFISRALASMTTGCLTQH